MTSNALEGGFLNSESKRRNSQQLPLIMQTTAAIGGWLPGVRTNRLYFAESYSGGVVTCRWLVHGIMMQCSYSDVADKMVKAIGEA